MRFFAKIRQLRLPRYSLLIATLAAVIGYSAGIFTDLLVAPAIDVFVSKSDIKRIKMDRYQAVPAQPLTDQEILSIIRPSNRIELETLRQDLVSAIWQQANLPLDHFPQEVSSTNEFDHLNFQNLKSIEKFTIGLNDITRSFAYRIRAERGSNRLLIFHQGHDLEEIIDKAVIERYLLLGYDVLLLAMPLLWENRPDREWVDTADFGPIYLPRNFPNPVLPHNYISLLSSSYFDTARFFFDPVVISLNQAFLDKSYELVIMMGLSGGGWMSTVYPALDPRIDMSVQVAGSLPFYLRTTQPFELMDHEQFALPMYRLANYLEFYLLASLGENRQHLQILNVHDPCCFGSRPEARRYARLLQGLLENMEAPGTFNLYLDDTHREHAISPFALDVVDRHLRQYEN